MKPSEVREKTSDELARKGRELEEEIFRLKFRASSGQLKQTANIKKAREDLARIRTVERERAIAEAGKGA